MSAAKATVTAMDHSSSHLGSLHQAGPSPRAPLADMDPAPDTTLPIPLPAVVDSSTWPGPGGRGSASLPASPTIKPLHTSSSSAGSALSDGRLSPTKDSRADRFKLEQRKLLSAIKSDPKLGMVVSEGSLSSARSDPKLSVSSLREEGEQVDAGSVFTGDDVISEDVTVHPPAPLSVMEDVCSSSQTVAADEMILVPAESSPDPAADRQVPEEPKEEAGGESVSEVSAAVEKKEETGAVSPTQKDSSSSTQCAEIVPSSPAEKRDAKTRKFAERSSTGVKSQGSAGTTPGRSGIRLGIGSSTKLDSSSSARSSSVTMGGKVSPAGKMSRPSTVSVSQRRTNITGLSSGGSSPNTSPQTSQARSVLTRYPPSSTPPPSSTSRRPIASLPPSSTMLSRSSTGSVPNVARRSATYTSSPDSSPRGGPSSSTSSDSSPASIGGTGARARRLSGEKSGTGGGGSTRESAAALRASGNGSLSKTGVRTGVGSPRNMTGGVGKNVSGGSAVSRSGTNGASRVNSAVSTAGTAATASVGTGKAGVSLSTVVESSRSTKNVSSVVSTDSGTTTTSTASGGRFQEKSQDQKSAESSSFSSGAKDLSSDRTPRFV